MPYIGLKYFAQLLLLLASKLSPKKE